MLKIRRSLMMALVLAVVPATIAGGAKKILTLRIWLFEGRPSAGRPGPARPEVLPFSTTPEFTPLQSLVAEAQDDLKKAVIDALLEREDLRSLDELFLFKQTQREDQPFPGQVILGRQLAYRIRIAHKNLTPRRVALHIGLSKTIEGVIRPERDDRTMLRNAYEASLDEEKMAPVVDQALEIGFDDPVVVTVPQGERPLFLLVKLTEGEPQPKRMSAPTIKLPKLSNLMPAPRPVEKIAPAYPEELRRRGVRGDVGFLVAIDETGSVQRLQVVSPLHPYLDYAASQALWQWRFDPVLLRGKPVPAAFEYTLTFSPEAYAAEAISVEEGAMLADGAARLRTVEILSACASYCRKLRDAALFYVCEETLREITHGLVPADRLAEIALRPRDTTFQVNESADGQMSGWLPEHPQIIERRRADRIGFSCDYQMVRRFGEIEERRIVLKADGRRIADRVELLEERRYAALSPVVSVLKILEEDCQALFHYRPVKEDRISGRNVHVVEVVPKLGDADGIRSAKVWLEPGSSRIVRCEIEGVPLEGYEDILEEAVMLNIRPRFVRAYEFRTEHDGLFLPDRTEVRVDYPALVRNRWETKAKIDIAYKDFKFFTVETGHDVIR